MISVAIPMYNEAPNAAAIVEAVRSELGDREHEIIVVDGDSTDGTADILAGLAEEFDTVRCIHRDERHGIGSAYREAFRAAEGDILVQMDADFSHPPEQILDLVEAVETGADVAVGSRYVDGGERDDPVHRRVFPLIGSYLYRFLLRSPVRDVTSGFKAYRREAADQLGDGSLPDGFHFQAASLFELLDEGYTVEEVPITFRERRDGTPKYGAGDLIDNTTLLTKLAFREHIQLFKFAFIGGLGIGVDTGVLYALTEFAGLYYMFSAVAAGETAILFNFVFHDAWTFREEGESGVRAWLSRLYQYHVVSLSGIALKLLLLFAFTDILGIYYVASNIVAIGIVFLWNYVANVLWTWSE